MKNKRFVKQMKFDNMDEVSTQNKCRQWDIYYMKETLVMNGINMLRCISL